MRTPFHCFLAQTSEDSLLCAPAPLPSPPSPFLNLEFSGPGLKLPGSGWTAHQQRAQQEAELQKGGANGQQGSCKEGKEDAGP